MRSLGWGERGGEGGVVRVTMWRSVGEALSESVFSYDPRSGDESIDYSN